MKSINKRANARTQNPKEIVTNWGVRGNLFESDRETQPTYWLLVLEIHEDVKDNKQEQRNKGNLYQVTICEAQNSRDSDPWLGIPVLQGTILGVCKDLLF